MKIALIAHDKKKQDMVQFTTAYKDILSHHELYATGTTGLKIQEATGLSVERFQSGPLGGDQQIGALIAANALDLVIFSARSVNCAASRTGCLGADPAV